MPWMPVNSKDNAQDSHIMLGVIIAGGMALMLIGVPLARPFLYSIPAAFVAALGMRYWHKRHGVDLIHLGYKDHPNRD